VYLVTVEFDRIAEAAEGVEKDLLVLIEGLNRLGSLQPDGSKACTFAEVFADEALEQ
jgi:hypothetical protein